ncbi:MAG: aminotransferase class III-fold pyridoxal phosphate-dependent enzyme, partial [Chloroflexota bacterium]|nr:aminotransferase class III-fold pyridoxal phosphate-dependent enzyme [Chloroflexota bacterium]
IEAIMSATNDRTAAVMLEPVQGEGGVNIPSEDYLLRVRQWCDQKGLLLMFDEVQTGLGRLGTLWGYQQFGVEPDVMALAKGLGGGAPIGAFLSKDRCMALEPGDHGSTFGGNALTCAAAYASVKYTIDHKLWENAHAMGARVMDGLKALQSRFSVIKEVRGRGLLIAVEFNDAITPKLVAQTNQEGLLLNPLKPNAIRIMPPLTITAAEVDEGLAKLEAAFKRI